MTWSLTHHDIKSPLLISDTSSKQRLDIIHWLSGMIIKYSNIKYSIKYSIFKWDIQIFQY